jgi:hypothetical protein
MWPFAHCSMRWLGASRHTEHFRCSGTPSSSSRARTCPRLAAVALIFDSIPNPPLPASAEIESLGDELGEREETDNEREETDGPATCHVPTGRPTAPPSRKWFARRRCLKDRTPHTAPQLKKQSGETRDVKSACSETGTGTG